MAINTGPSSYAGGKAAQANTMGNRVARQRGGARPAMGGGGGKSVMGGNMGGPMGPGGAPNVGAPIFGASVMPGMEGTSDTPMMGGGRPNFMDMIPGGGFTGGMNRGMGPMAGNINSVGPGAAPPQPAVAGPRPMDMRARAGGMRPKFQSFGYNPVQTGPSGY